MKTSKFVKPRKAVEWFSHRMEMRLQENDYKSGWTEPEGIFFNAEKAMSYALKEWREADLELKVGNRSEEKIINECADAANFLMMVADRIQKGLP